MNRVILILFACALVVLAAPGAQGQSSTQATGTSQATPVPTPLAQDLIAQSYAAQQRQGAMHWTESLHFSTPKKSRETDITTGDISWRDNLLRQVTTAHTTNLHKKPNTTHVSKTRELAAAGVLATRTDKKPWDCSTADLSSGDSSGSGDEVSDSFLEDAQFTETNLGLETLNGIQVWHVRETMTIPGMTPQGRPGVGDYYISQADQTPVREIVSLTMTFLLPAKGSSYTREKIIQHSVQNYGQYGETFQVTLPRACRGTGSVAQRAGSMLGATWSRAVGRAARLALRQHRLGIRRFQR